MPLQPAQSTFLEPEQRRQMEMRSYDITGGARTKGPEGCGLGGFSFLPSSFLVASVFSFQCCGRDE